MSRHDAIAVLPGLQKDNDGPIFREPWEAQAFAMTLLLHEKGLFTWQEWTQVLSDRIAAASETGEPDTGETYYLHWLAALEALVAEKGLADAAQLTSLKYAWDAAAKSTPHGQPIVLPPDEV